LDAKVDAEVNNLYVKRIGIEDLLCYVYIVRVDTLFTVVNWTPVFLRTVDFVVCHQNLEWLRSSTAYPTLPDKSW
jgi:hypothetical protein